MNKQGPNIFDLIESYYHDLKQELGFNPENIDDVKGVTRLGINESGSYDYVMADGKSKKAYRMGEDLRVLAGLHVLPQKVGRSRISDKAAFWLPGVSDQYSLDALKEEGADPTETLYRAAAFIVMEIVRLNTLKVDKYNREWFEKANHLLPIQSINVPDAIKIGEYLGFQIGEIDFHDHCLELQILNHRHPISGDMLSGSLTLHFDSTVEVRFNEISQRNVSFDVNPAKYIKFVTQLGYEFNDYSV